MDKFLGISPLSEDETRLKKNDLDEEMFNMDVQFKSEKLCDYSAMTSVSQEAFHGWHLDNWYVSEPVMAGLPEQGEELALDLSMITEIAGEDTGHVLFSIYQFIVAETVQNSAVAATVFLPYSCCKKHLSKQPFLGKQFIDGSVITKAA
ncbi:MAG: hypothetical protein GX115_11020 [Ruminiclostridium sp.]|nr:hypothetical protein [Ruminiclostridium sp.]